MSVDREPAQRTVALSRRRLGVYTFLVIATSLTIAIASLIIWEAAADAGRLYLWVLLGCALTVTFATLGARVVRGGALPTMIVAALAATPAVLGAVLFRQSVGVTIRTLGGHGDLTAAARTLAAGAVEANVSLVFGCALAGCGFLTLSVALLGSAASFDRGSATPAGLSWITPLGLGLAGVLTTIAIRAIRSAVFVEFGFTVAALIVMASLASVAARNGRFAREWLDRREAHSWAASVLVAAVAGAAAVALADVVAELHTESVGLASLLRADNWDYSDRARVLLQTLDNTRASHLYAWVDGAVAFAIVSSALIAMGRKPDGEMRTPLGRTLYVALGSVVVVIATIVGVRMSSTSASEDATAAYALPIAPTPAMPHVDLPVVADVIVFTTGSGGGPTLTVQASGASTVSRPVVARPGEWDFNLEVYADQKAKWSAVASAIHETLGGKYGSAMARLPTLSIHVVSTASQDQTRFREYAVFLGRPISALEVCLEQAEQPHLYYPSADESPQPSVSARGDEDMDAVVAHITANNRGRHGPILMSPTGDWRH